MVFVLYKLLRHCLSFNPAVLQKRHPPFSIQSISTKELIFMVQGTGYPAYPGIVIGRVFLYKKPVQKLPPSCGDPAAEQQKFEAACETARKQLQTLFEEAKSKIGEEDAMILDVQLMMLEDLDYQESVAAMIQNGAGAAQAARETGDAFYAAFASMEDAYMQARAADVADLSQRILGILCGDQSSAILEHPGILLAEDLTPSETVQLPKENILAFVTRQGSSNSHTAILARIMNIPSLVQTQIELDDSLDGKLMIVDGFTGNYYIDPDADTLACMQKKQQQAVLARSQLEAYRGKESVTKKGRKISLFANIGSPEDVKAALEGDAEGIGLLRSEFLYLGRERFPSEEELFTAYKKVVIGMNGRPVIIRTLDIGADKKADYFGLPQEENPALGYRGIRICLSQREIFCQQLRAIYRAAALGSVSILFPMITSVWEVQQIKAICAEVQTELKAEGIPCGAAKLGIMIETPAAAMISDLLAKEVDFFSIGSNDLTQYTLAIDRQNANLDSFYDAHHPAVLRLLKLTAANAHKAGIRVGICGELGADSTLTEDFIQMGFDALSVSPGRILEIRKQICESEAIPYEGI